MANENIEKIKGRIKSLLMKAADPACSGEEADTCLAKAKELMERYSVSEEHIAERSGEPTFKKYEADGRKGPDGKYIVHPLDRLAGVTLAKFCGVKVWLNSEWFTAPNGKEYRIEKGVVYFGQEADVELCSWMRQALIERLEADWERFKKREGSRRMTNLKEQRVGFVRGFAKAVNDRFNDWIYRAQPDAPEGQDRYALVVKKTDLVEAEMKRMGIKLGHAPRRRTAAEDAIAVGAGYNSGKAADASRGVGGAHILIG